MDNNDSMLQLGKLSGQFEAMQGRIKALEVRVDQSDRLIVEKLESLQVEVQSAVLQMHKQSSVLELNRKLILGIAGITGFGGAGGAAILQTMGVF